MNLSTTVIDGVTKLIMKIAYTGKRKENVIRVYDPKDSRVPEMILHESKTHKNVYIDDVNEKIYREINGRLMGL